MLDQMFFPFSFALLFSYLSFSNAKVKLQNTTFYLWLPWTDQGHLLEPSLT
jgi:hypothetical protein